jgi:hypothetical protein
MIPTKLTNLYGFTAAMSLRFAIQLVSYFTILKPREKSLKR